MKRVIIESPYKGNSYADLEENMRYLRACIRDCLLRGEAPFASHAIYTQEGVLDDIIESERNQGIEACFAWRLVADLTVVYTDKGISTGMRCGIDHALAAGLPIEYRSLADCKEE
jgi:hypothetical protein